MAPGNFGRFCGKTGLPFRLIELLDDHLVRFDGQSIRQQCRPLVVETGRYHGLHAFQVRHLGIISKRLADVSAGCFTEQHRTLRNEGSGKSLDGLYLPVQA